MCNLGDTFHDHAVVRSELLSEFHDRVSRIAKHTPYWYILGNHDQYKPKDSKYHALQTFSIPNFTVFDKVTELDGITIVPYVQEYSDFPKQTQPICITHNTFIGADYGYKKEDAGIDPDLVSAEVIISGHIHKKQDLGKVKYPGTPVAHNASDVDQSKGLLLFDTATYSCEFIESPFPMWRSIEFEMVVDGSIDELHSTLEQELNDTDKWILKVSGPKVEITSYFRSKKYIALAKNKNIMTKLTPTDKSKKKIQIKSTSIEDIMSEYVDKVYHGEIDKQLILQKALQIVKNTK